MSREILELREQVSEYERELVACKADRDRLVSLERQVTVMVRLDRDDMIAASQKVSFLLLLAIRYTLSVF
jgi:hypothetical protein